MEKYDNDIYIWQRLMIKDPSAFECIYKKYRVWLTISAINILQNEVEAQDLVQKFFISLWQMEETKFPVLNGPLKNFLFVSIRNRCLDQIRSDERKKRRYASLQLPLSYEPPTNVLENKELQRQLDAAIKQLPDIRSRVFKLGYIHQKTRQEIAAELGISEATVKNHMALALKNMRELLKDKVY